MRVVEDGSGRRWVLVRRSRDASRVRDPATGEERYLDTDDLAAVAGETALEAAAGGIPEPVRRAVTAARDEASLGLLVALATAGPLPARSLLDAHDWCESDLHGALAEFRAAGLVSPVSIGGEPAYAATERAEAAVRLLLERA